MARQYLRKSEPYDQNPGSDWIMMTGKELYRVISSPEGRRRKNPMPADRQTVDHFPRPSAPLARLGIDGGSVIMARREKGAGSLYQAKDKT